MKYTSKLTYVRSDKKKKDLRIPGVNEMLKILTSSTCTQQKKTSCIHIFIGAVVKRDEESQ